MATSLIDKVEQMKKLHRLLILVGTIILLGGLFIYFIYVPKSKEIDLFKREIISLNQQIARVKLAQKKLVERKKKKALVEAQFQEALRLLPNEREIPSLLRTITQLGSDSNLEFMLFSPKKEREKDFYKEIPVSVEVSGLYHDVAVFFDKVGKMERIINIVDMNMKPVKDRSTTLVTSCEAVTYRFKKGANVSEPKKTTAVKRKR